MPSVLGDLPYSRQPLPSTTQTLYPSEPAQWKTPSSDARGGRRLDVSSGSQPSPFIHNFSTYQLPVTSAADAKFAKFSAGTQKFTDNIRPFTTPYRTNNDEGKRLSKVKARPASSMSPSRGGTQEGTQSWDKYHADIAQNAQNWYDRTDRYTAEAFGGADVVHARGCQEPNFFKDDAPTYTAGKGSQEKHFRHVGNVRSNAPLIKKEKVLPPRGWTKDFRTLDRSLQIIPKLAVPARFGSKDGGSFDHSIKVQHPLYTTFSATHGVRAMHPIELPDKYFGLETKFTGTFQHKFRRSGLNTHVAYERSDRAMNVM